MAYLQTITKPKTVGWLSQKLAEQDTRIKELEKLHGAARTLASATAGASDGLIEAVLVPIPEYDALLEALRALAGKQAKP